MAALTAARLRELLHYSPETGEWRWRVSGRSRVFAGKIAGGKGHSCGYWRIGIGGHRYYSHRLAVLYMTGSWPAAEVDHIDGIPGNDWWSNLRQASHGQNMLNAKRRSHNTSGFKGVCWAKQQQRWKARLIISGKQIHLGFYTSAAAAAQAVRAGAPIVHGEFARVD
jgi:hypothetical protein